MTKNVNEEIFKDFTFREKPIEWTSDREGIIKLSENNYAIIQPKSGLYKRLIGYKVKIESLEHKLLNKTEYLFSDLIDKGEVWYKADQLKWYVTPLNSFKRYLKQEDISEISSKLQKRIFDYLYQWVEDWE
jgi:hypothetical protein